MLCQVNLVEKSFRIFLVYLIKQFNDEIGAKLKLLHPLDKTRVEFAPENSATFRVFKFLRLRCSQLIKERGAKIIVLYSA